MRLGRALSACALLLLLLSGCAGEQERAERGAKAPQPPVASVPGTTGQPGHVPQAALRRCRPGEERDLGSRRLSYVAVAVEPLAAYSRPGGSELHRFGVRNVNNFPTVFGVLGSVLDWRCRALWYRVQLPVRPNGATGYVAADAIRLEPVTTWIEVDLSERRVELLDGGRPVLRLTAAIGKPTTPTPTGRFYVNQRLRARDPSGPYGPGGIGISAFSPVLTGWAQGGPIAIHGTNAPATIGEPASNGCLRVENEAVERLFDLVPAGTPVVIRA